MEIAIIRDGKEIASAAKADETYLVFNEEYMRGDAIRFTPDSAGYYVVDLGLGKNLLYSTGSSFAFPIPFDEKKIPYSESSFTGKVHYLFARRAYDFELVYRNVSENIYDWSGNSTLYPHSKANIETRGESVFASRNAFDGIIASSSHGLWPFQSWGINRDPDAELTLEFGRPIAIDRVIFYLRADFPHDAWWNRGTIEFSDGSSETFDFIKKDGPQMFMIEKREASSLVLKNLIKSDDPSPFPALIQLEVFGA